MTEETKENIFTKSITSKEKHSLFPTSIYLLKVNYRNTRTRCKICSKLTIKTQERRQRVFNVNFEHLIGG